MADGPDPDRISVAAFVRDLRWMLPAMVGLMLVMYYFDVGGTRDYSVWEPVLFGIGFVVTVGPLSWLSLGQVRGRGREFWRFFAGAMAWAAFSVTAIAALMYAFGLD